MCADFACNFADAILFLSILQSTWENSCYLSPPLPLLVRWERTESFLPDTLQEAMEDEEEQVKGDSDGKMIMLVMSVGWLVHNPPAS